MNTNDFTRKRKQSFCGTILFLLNFLRKSLCIEISNLVNHLQQEFKNAKSEYFTKSAFVQYRKKISADVFVHLSNLLVSEFYRENACVKLFHGFRLLAVDTSIVNLPKKTGLEDIYGKSQNQAGDYLVQARVSVLYDVLNKFSIDSIIAPVNTSERDMGLGHLNKASCDDLIIYDRGYPSYDFINKHQQLSIDYLMRVSGEFNNVVRSFVKTGSRDQVVEIYPGHHIDFNNKSYTRTSPLKVRLISLKLSSHQMEYLITSLLDSTEYPIAIFKDLYFQRWKVETYFDELKNKLKLEFFSGYSHQSILQDFYATIFVSNIQSLIVNELEEELQEEPSCRKYQYKVNSSLSYGFMKNRIISLFFFEGKQTEEIIDELKNLFKKHMIPVRPNRSNKRDMLRYKKRVRPKVTKNQKDAI